MNEKQKHGEDPGDIGFDSQEVEDAYLASVREKILQWKAEQELERKAELRKDRDAA